MLMIHPIDSINYLLEKIGIKRMNDEKYIKYIYERVNDGDRLNLENPVTYDDKLNWMKLHDHRDIYTTMADKLRVKKFVADKIGQEYVIKLINDSHGGVYDCFDDIDFSELPERFVLKVNHDCGGVYICTDKSKLNIPEMKQFFDTRMKRNFYYAGREWAYKNIDKKIFCEEYVENLSDNNYKFFCFGGEVKCLYVAPYREKTVDYFDENFEHLDIYTRIHQGAEVPPSKPDSFEQMKSIAEKLASDVPAVRVDLYESNGKIYFGEFTFFHEAGFTPFMPEKWNNVFGSWMNNV
jgi:hypothetical protein